MNQFLVFKSEQQQECKPKEWDEIDLEKFDAHWSVFLLWLEMIW
jgi:hypothetical protein